MQQRNNPVTALVLLTVCFAWACDQLVPTAPPAPPAVDSVNSATSISPSSARGGTGSDMYKYWGEGDPTFIDNPQDAQPVSGSGDTVHLCGAACGDSVKGQFLLSAAIRSHWPEHADNCFGDNSVPVPATVFVSRDKKSPGSVLGRVWFSGMGTGGEQAVKYVLRLTGQADHTFPPGPEDTAMVVWGSGEMTTEGKGKGSKGGNAGTACTGEVSVIGSFTLTGCPGVDSCL